MDLLRDVGPDSITSLEERILKTVQLVSRLREERDAALHEAGEARAQLNALFQEVENLRAEREQVRARIEKLLAQMDALGGG